MLWFISRVIICALLVLRTRRMIGIGQKQSVHKDGAMEGVNGVNVKEG